MAARVGLRTIFKGSTDLRNDLSGEKFTVHEEGYPEESDMPSLDILGFFCTVVLIIKVL